jgi:hypothetical protein
MLDFFFFMKYKNEHTLTVQNQQQFKGYKTYVSVK